MTTAEMAELIFRMYAQRWSIEDTFKTAKATLGLESVQVLDYNAIRRLEALGWVALGYRLELGVTLDWPEVRLLQRLGGWRGPGEPAGGEAGPAPRPATPARPPGDRSDPGR